MVVQVLEYKAKNKRTKETLLTCLADLFYSIVTQKRKVAFVDLFSLSVTLDLWRQLFCEGGNDCTEKVHCTAEEREGGVRQLHAAGQHQLASEKTKEDFIVLDYTKKTIMTKSHIIEEKPLLQDAHEFLIFLINHINEIIVGEQPAPAKTLGPGQTSRPNESPPTWINDIFQVSSFFALVSKKTGQSTTWINIFVYVVLNEQGTMGNGQWLMTDGCSD